MKKPGLTAGLFLLARMESVALLQQLAKDEKIRRGKPIRQSFHRFTGLTQAAVSGPETDPPAASDRAAKALIFHDFSRQRNSRERIAATLAGPAGWSEKKDSAASPRRTRKENLKFPNQLHGDCR